MCLDSELEDPQLNREQHEKPEHDCDYCNHSQELFRALLLQYEPLFLTLTPQEIPTSTSFFCAVHPQMRHLLTSNPHVFQQWEKRQ